MPFAGMYEKMTFPPYEYHEYPKEVTLKDGEKKIVANAAEELALATEVSKPIDAKKLAFERDAVTNALADREAQISALKAELEALKTAQAINAQGTPKVTEPAVPVKTK